MTELSLYLSLWESFGGRIDWGHDDPRRVAEQVSYVIWSYIQEIGCPGDNDKGSVIGHAALYAKLQEEETERELVFSNTGGNVGFYSVPPKLPWRYFFRGILMCFYVLESLAGHLEDGKWETLREFRKRVRRRRPPRVQKVVLRGDDANQAFQLLELIHTVTSADNAGPGAPEDYGLNTTAVRLLDDFDRPLLMRSYNIDGVQREIHGGCANALASVLDAANLSHLVPRQPPVFVERPLSFDLFPIAEDGAVLPVVQNDEGFDRNGNAVDEDVRRELDRLSPVWGDGDLVRFFDPNHWYDLIPDEPANFRELKRQLGI